MYIPGHLSVAYLLTRGRERAATYAVLLGALAPDLLDKPLRLVGWTPYGRTIGHAALVWLLAWLLWALWRLRAPAPSVWRQRALWFLIGATSHLFADLANDVVAGVLFNAHLFSAWFAYPYRTPDDWPWLVGGAWMRCRMCPTPLEVGVVVLALWAWRRRPLDPEAQPSYQEDTEA